MQVLKFSIWSLILMIGLLSSCSDDLDIDTLDGITQDENESDNDSSNSLLGSDVITAWTDLFLDIDRYADGMRPTATARALAYIHLAAYETAAPGLKSYESATSFLSDLEISTDEFSQDINVEIALNTAYAFAIDHFMINMPNDVRSQISDLESTLETSLSVDLFDTDVQVSQTWGQYVAEQVIDYALTDVIAEAQILDPQPLSYIPPTGDGFWTFSAEPERALYPYWEEVRTFVISSQETSTIDPLNYSENPTSDYFQQMQEVYEANNGAKEDQGEELWIAEFWSDDVTTLMFSPPARQFSIANQLIEQEDLDMGEALYLNLKLGFSLNDAAVSSWADKYEYMVMRPNVFIHEFIDPDYQTNLFRLVPWPNPSFPGYPSGHSTFASAAGGIFIDFFGDDVTFTDRSHEARTEFQSEPRTYQSISDMAFENAYSRIPLGVHVRMDCDEGLRLGYEIADAINQVDLSSSDGIVNEDIASGR